MELITTTLSNGQKIIIETDDAGLMQEDQEYRDAEAVLEKAIDMILFEVRLSVMSTSRLN